MSLFCLLGGVVEEIRFPVGVEVGAHRTLVGLVLDGRLLEVRLRHLNGREEDHPAVGTPQEERRSGASLMD